MTKVEQLLVEVSLRGMRILREVPLPPEAMQKFYVQKLGTWWDVVSIGDAMNDLDQAVKDTVEMLRQQSPSVL